MLSLSAVVWPGGVNDFNSNGSASVEAVQAGVRDVVGRTRARRPRHRRGGRFGARRHQPRARLRRAV
ncbi:MAG: hypothetical protein ICV73_15075 [Acetobacteraceae bacterium]|nr:hypothetical protein [Acetobacteraceae bacterium]